MKKVIRTAAMVALMFATATGLASEPKLIVSTKADTKSFVYELDDTSSFTSLKLVDSENHIIYSQSLTGGTFAKRFDMKNLKNGLYYFTSEDALRTISYTLEVDGKLMSVLSKKEIAKPTFKIENGMVYIHLLNLDKKAVEIAVYDSEDRLIFSEKRENEMVVEKALSFTKAFEDNYTIVIRNGENSYFENVVVK